MIVIPMAGLSRRFFKAGYTRPKYELDLHGRPVFDHAVGSFAEQFGREHFLFVMRSGCGAEEFVRTRLEALGLPRADLAVLDCETQGQAETVLLGLERAQVPGSEPLVIFNIDSFRPGWRMGQEERAADGYLEVFHGEGEGWSFVEPMADGSARAARVLEKRRISDLCCTGLYYFASRDLFEWAYVQERRAPSQDIGEHYVAPLYNPVIAAGKQVLWRLIPRNEVIFCGTPAEYEALLAAPGGL